MTSRPALRHAHPNSVRPTFAPHRVSSRCLAWLSQDEHGDPNAEAAAFKSKSTFLQEPRNAEAGHRNSQPLSQSTIHAIDTVELSSFTISNPDGRLWLDKTIGDEPSGLTPPSTPSPRPCILPLYFWSSPPKRHVNPTSPTCHLRGGGEDAPINNGKSNSIQATSAYHGGVERSTRSPGHIRERSEREVFLTHDADRYLHALRQYLRNQKARPVSPERVRSYYKQQGSRIPVPSSLKRVTAGSVDGHPRALGTPSLTAPTSSPRSQSQSLKNVADVAEDCVSQKGDNSPKSGSVNDDNALVGNNAGTTEAVSSNDDTIDRVSSGANDGAVEGSLHPFTARPDSRARPPLNEEGQMVSWGNTDGRFTHYAGSAIPLRQSDQVRHYPPVMTSGHAYVTETRHDQQTHSPRKTRTEHSRQILQQGRAKVEPTEVSTVPPPRSSRRRATLRKTISWENAKRLLTFRRPISSKKTDEDETKRVRLRGGGEGVNYRDIELFIMKHALENITSWDVRRYHVYEGKGLRLEARHSRKKNPMKKREDWSSKELPPSRFLPRQALRKPWILPPTRIPGSRYESAICSDYRERGSNRVVSGEIRFALDHLDYVSDSQTCSRGSRHEILPGALKTILAHHMSFPYDPPVRPRQFHRDLAREVLRDIDETIRSWNQKLEEIARERDPCPASSCKRVRTNREGEDPKPEHSLDSLSDSPPSFSPELPMTPPPSPISTPPRPDTPQDEPDDLSPSEGVLDLRRKRLSCIRRDSVLSFQDIRA